MSGKKFADAVKKFDRDQLFTPTEALAMVKSLASAKFDETVEIAMRLGVDPRKADQMVRGTVALLAMRVPTSSVPTIWLPRSRRASSTSTSPSPPPT